MSEAHPSRASVLVAGIGNIFLGDDGFGCEVVRRLFTRPVPDGVRIVDFGIRGIDLAYALLGPYDAAILVDATARGGAPGTLYVLDPSPTESPRPLEDPTNPAMHGVDPVKAIALARSMGHVVRTLRLVGCEPQTLGGDDELHADLSAPVEAAVEAAVRVVEQLVTELRSAATRGTRDA